MSNVKDIPCLVLGIGNILWADEGFGVRAVEAFNAKYALTDVTAVVADGGTLGMFLYDMICRAENILVFDCCDFHAAPGSKAVLKDDEISVWTSTKLSPHQDGMNDLLAAAALRGASPGHIAVVGFQPVLLDDYGGSISDKAKSLIPEAVEDGAAVLKAWGVGIRKRTPDEAVPSLRGTECLDIRTYEAGRPSAEAACRSGDERFARFISKKE